MRSDSSIACVLLLLVEFAVAALRPATIQDYNNFTENVFTDCILDEVVNFRFYGTGLSKNYPEGSREQRIVLHQPRIFGLFDWVISGHWFRDGDFMGDASQDPRSVLVIPGRKDIMKHVPALQPEQMRVLVMAGEDRLLSHNLVNPLGAPRPPHNPSNSTEAIFTRFTSVFIEAKDVENPRIRTVPMGFTNVYIFKAGIFFVTDVVKETRAAGRAGKTSLAFAAWGKEWGNLDNSLSDRVHLARFLSQASTKLWIKRQLLDHQSYWKTLAKHRFSLCPSGNGIQSPKLYEAMVLQTVPVVTYNPAFKDLIDLGFPMLMVTDWNILTREFLEEQYEKVFRHVDWEIVYRMMTVDGVWSLLMDGERYPFDSPLSNHPQAAAACTAAAARATEAALSAKRTTAKR